MPPKQQESLISSTVPSPVQTAPPAFRILTANMKSRSTFKRPVVPYTIVAPVFFMENLLQPWILSSLRQGKLAMALPARRSLQQIAVADIGAFVAAVIERGDTVFGRRFDIAGDELTGEEAVAILSKVTGREVHYEAVPPDVLRAQSEDMAMMFEWFDSTGYAADMKNLRRDFPEVKWHTFEEWARKQDWSILDQS